ncbi:MAG: sulfatase-like hydrolase/transferase [Planctomycetota bacterium]
MTDRKPNILFFFTDDQRFDTLAALGNDAIRTPHLDRLVGRGAAFTHAHIMGGNCGAVCMPSRAMLMTGRTLFHLEDMGQQIPEDHTLLGEALQAAGYQTFGAGKWHNGIEAYARSFTDGREYTALPFCHNAMKSNELGYRLCDHIKPGVHSSDLLADAAIDYLGRRDKAKPFFAYVSFLAPHDPRTMPEEFLKMYPPEEVELPANYMPGHPFNNGELKIRDELLEDFPRTESAIRKHIAEYYAMISHLDAQIGRVLAALDEAGETDNTIIVFAGDNGLAVGRHGLMGKQSMYDHSVRVPLVFAGPGVPAGVRRDAFCYLLDIFPTLCDLVGAETPASVEGQSLVPIFADPAAPARETLHFAYTHCQRAVRDAQYKLIEYVVEEAPRVTQLFDLQADPDELHNLADDPAHAETLQRLRAELLRWRDEFGDTTHFGETFWGGYGAA